jgi:hypothetical protein
MKRLLSSCLAISAIGLMAPKPVSAAALDINDTGAEPNIVFSMNDFEGGFLIDGTLRQQGLNNLQTFTVSEGTAATGPIVHTFEGNWITGGLVPQSAVIAFAEAGISPSVGVSDILRFTYDTGGQGLGGHLTGSFESDLDPGLLPLPTGATVVSEATPFFFNNGNISADARSDVEPVPLPKLKPIDSLVILVTALLGFGFLRRRHNTG